MQYVDALAVFRDSCEHPLSRLLCPGFRHVLVALLDDRDASYWIEYDWGTGSPSVRTMCAGEYDLIGFYEDRGDVVVEVTRALEPLRGPLMLNNCVAHAKLLLGYRCAALTPYQLYKYLVREKERKRAWTTSPT